MTHKALKLALEALQSADKLINGSGTSGGLLYCMDAYYSDCFDADPIVKQIDEAVAAIKEALAQPAQEPVAWKLMPRDATDAMLKAMDECSTEGYDERLYAGHAASVYMAAWDASDTAYRPSGLARPAQEQVARIAVLEAALNEIAYAGMSVSQEMSDDYKQAWHASRAWEFIGIAAQAIDQESTPRPGADDHLKVRSRGI